MRTDAHNTRKHLGSDPVRSRAVDHGLEPAFVLRVIMRVGAKGVNEDVDVREDQSCPSMRSRRAALSFRSTPGSAPPPARHSGNDTRGRFGRFIGRRSTSSRPCSISDVSVVFRLTASARARSSSAASKRTVVLICHSIRHGMSICLGHMWCKGPKSNLGAAAPRSSPPRVQYWAARVPAWTDKAVTATMALYDAYPMALQGLRLRALLPGERPAKVWCALRHALLRVQPMQRHVFQSGTVRREHDTATGRPVSTDRYADPIETAPLMASAEVPFILPACLA